MHSPIAYLFTFLGVVSAGCIPPLVSMMMKKIRRSEDDKVIVLLLCLCAMVLFLSCVMIHA